MKFVIPPVRNTEDLDDNMPDNFYPPEDANGSGTNGPPRSLSGSSAGCGQAAFVLAAPLLLLGMRRQR